MNFPHSALSGRCLGVLLLLLASCSIGKCALGVNYGTVANDLPSPAQVVSLIQSTYITHVKIYDTNAEILTAFANTGIALVVGARNDEISSLAASESFAQDWVTQNVASYYPATNIISIVVGNEVLTTAQNSSLDLVPAMQNLYTGLSNLNLNGNIKVSTPHSMAVLGASYPPSDGIFRSDLSGPIFSPMLDFLSQTGAPFMINVYPYFAYRDNPDISISYALFGSTGAVVDAATGLSYSSLFDAQVDAAYAAMAKLGHQDITVVVSETGWPSDGDPEEVGVGMTNAQTYVSNLLQQINSRSGTPNKPAVEIDTYIFALFNENQKPGPSSERHFGLFLPDQSAVYNVGLVTATTNASSPPPPVVSTSPPPSSPPPPAPTPNSTPESPPPPASPAPASFPPPFTSSPPPPSTITTPPPPYTAPPPPYPVPHVPPIAGSTPFPPPFGFTYPPPPATVTPPPPPSFFTPPPGSTAPSPSSGTPPYLPSPPPPATSSPPPASPPPSPLAPQAPPQSPPAPESPPASPPPPVSPPPSLPPPPPAAPSPQLPPSPPPPAVPSPPAEAPAGTPPAPPGTASGPNTWCVAKPGSAAEDLSNALNYACGEGGADCSQIQAGGACFNPDTLFSHASYAFSSYYAINGRNYWNCFFGNSSLITITSPSYAGCNYP